MLNNAHTHTHSSGILTSNASEVKCSQRSVFVFVALRWSVAVACVSALFASPHDGNAGIDAYFALMIYSAVNFVCLIVAQVVGIVVLVRNLRVRHVIARPES